MKNVLKISKGKRAAPDEGDKRRADIIRSVAPPMQVLIDTPSLVIIGSLTANMALEDAEVWQ